MLLDGGVQTLERTILVAEADVGHERDIRRDVGTIRLLHCLGEQFKRLVSSSCRGVTVAQPRYAERTRLQIVARCHCRERIVVTPELLVSEAEPTVSAANLRIELAGTFQNSTRLFITSREGESDSSADAHDRSKRIKLFCETHVGHRFFELPERHVSHQTAPLISPSVIRIALNRFVHEANRLGKVPVVHPRGEPQGRIRFSCGGIELDGALRSSLGSGKHHARRHDQEKPEEVVRVSKTGIRSGKRRIGLDRSLIKVDRLLQPFRRSLVPLKTGFEKRVVRLRINCRCT